MLKRIPVILLLSIIMYGCIKEDMTGCGRLRFQFSYTRNKQGVDLLPGRVKDIRVYVFDRHTGILTHMLRPGKQDILNGYVDIDLPDGHYTISAWGGGCEDMMECYFDAEMDDPASLSFTLPARIGSTTIDNFRLMLACEPLPGSANGTVAPKNGQFYDLFFDYAHDITAVKSENRTVHFDFINNTSTLKVKVTGLSHLLPVAASGKPLELFVEGRNEIYGYDNHNDEHTPVMLNEPPAATVAGDVMAVDIRMQRLVIGDDTAGQSLLYVRNADTKQDMIAPLDIMGAILQVKDAQGNLVYRTQEDIDREEEFPVEISILADLSVTVSVKGFEVVDATPDMNPKSLGKTDK